MIIATLKQNKINALKSGDRKLANFLSLLIGELERNPVKDDSDNAVIALLKKLIKGTRDLPIKTDVNFWEIEVMESYLPKQLSREEIVNLLSDASPSNLGEWMKHLKDNYAGLYDGKLASELYKENSR